MVLCITLLSYCESLNSLISEKKTYIYIILEEKASDVQRWRTASRSEVNSAVCGLCCERKVVALGEALSNATRIQVRADAARV